MISLKPHKAHEERFTGEFFASIVSFETFVKGLRLSDNF